MDRLQSGRWDSSAGTRLLELGRVNWANLEDGPVSICYTDVTRTG